jgi:hypothetical protein
MDKCSSERLSDLNGFAYSARPIDATIMTESKYGQLNIHPLDNREME